MEDFSLIEENEFEASEECRGVSVGCVNLALCAVGASVNFLYWILPQMDDGR